jgi:hypothetical protein
MSGSLSGVALNQQIPTANSFTPGTSASGVRAQDPVERRAPKTDSENPQPKNTQNTAQTERSGTDVQTYRTNETVQKNSGTEEATEQSSGPRGSLVDIRV